MTFQASPRLRRSFLPSLLALLLTSAAGTSAAQGIQVGGQTLFEEESIQGYDYTGPYAQFGIAIGRVDFDGNIDSDASGGFTMTGGYRLTPWLSAEGNFTFLGGEDNVELGSFEGDTEAWAFTFGPKIYPMALIDPDAIAHTIQPYGLIGIGGGEIEIEGRNGFESEDDSFVARFIIGVDVWATNHVGFFVEGGGFAVEEDDIDGVGIFTFGGQYRF
ncbi:MAG: outer membrane beta-barrel protein [Myxococcota bacterium]